MPSLRLGCAALLGSATLALSEDGSELLIPYPPVDGKAFVVDEFRFVESFETEPVLSSLSAGAAIATSAQEVLEGARSLKLQGGSSVSLRPESLSISSGETHRFSYRFRTLVPSATGTSIKVEAIWDGGAADLNALPDQVTGGQGTGIHVFRFGVVENPSFRITAAADAIVVVDFLITQKRSIKSLPAEVNAVVAGFPRLAKLGHGTLLEMNAHSGENTGTFLELLSRFHWVTGFQDDPTVGPDLVTRLREFSPGMLLSPSIEPFASRTDQTAISGASRISGLFNEAVPDQWTLKGPTGSPLTALADPGARFLNPTAMGGLVGGKRFGEFAASFLMKEMVGSGLYDGLHLDRFSAQPDAARLSPNGQITFLPVIDLNGDVIGESLDLIDSQWREGFATYQKDLRSRVGPGAILAGDGEIPGGQFEMNGWRHLPTSPYAVLAGGAWDTDRASGWYELVESYLGFEKQGSGLQTQLIQFNGAGLGSPAEATPLGSPGRTDTLEPEDFRRHRFGLASTLLGNGFFAYDLVDRSSAPLWFDEYSVGFNGAANGDRFGVNYLGQPLSGAEEIPRAEADELIHLDFESGMPAGLALTGTLTSDPSLTLDGNQSLIVSRAAGSPQNSILTINPATLAIPPDAMCELRLDYRVVEHLPETYGPLLEAGFDPSGLLQGANARLSGHRVKPGQKGQLRACVKIDGTHPAIMARLGDVGSAVIDNVRIVVNEAGVWRRDFEGGIVLVNPTPLPHTLSQSEVAGPLSRTNIRRIQGAQDPAWNDGSPVVAGIELPAGTGIILLAERISAQLPGTPTNLSGTAANDRVTLTWDGTGGTVATYLVEIAEGAGDFAESQIALPVPTATLTGLKPGTLYKFRVTAMDHQNRRSPASSVFALATLGTAPISPVITSFNQPQLRYGELMSVNVSNLSIGTETIAAPPFPSEINGISVTLNGVPALMVSVSPSLVGFVLPAGIPPGKDVIVRLRDGDRYGAGHRMDVRDPALTTVGNVLQTTLGNSSAEFVLENGAVARVSFLHADTVRVRLNPSGAFTQRLTGAISPQGMSVPFAVLSDSPGSVILETDAVRVTVKKAPFHVRVEDLSGNVILEDALSGIEWNAANGEISSVHTAIPGQPFFGLGLRGGPLDRRGQVLQMRNTDRCCYGEFDGPLYLSIPYYFSERGGRFFGVFHDNPSDASFDLDSGNRGEITYRAARGELDYYVFVGPKPQDVSSAFARLTGTSPLPPRWSLGYHQSRFGYSSDAEILGLAQTFRSLEIPVDSLWLDLDWMDGLNILDWDESRFPDPVGMRNQLQSMGFQQINIVDLAVQPDDPLTPFFLSNGVFLNDAQGNPVEETLFAPFNDVYWLDVTNPATENWYISALSGFLTTYHPAGIWNDLNELASNYLPSALYDFGGDPRPDIEARNIFALEELSQTRAAWDQAWPNERPFLLSRSGYPGIQRYAANWSGDTLSTFESMRVSVQTSLHMGLSGNNQFGHDIGGFLGNPSPELFLRWLAFGSYTTFFRNHALNTTDPREPWAYGEPYTSIARDIISQRYRILPYLYSLHELASREASPVLTPTVFHFPEDKRTYSQDTEFMLGPSLLVAPVYTAGATTRTVYLPAGTDWYEFEGSGKFTGGQEVTVAAPLDRIPVFVRAGAVIPLSPVRQFANEILSDDRITFHMYPGSHQVPALYEDDGISRQNESGVYLRTTVARRSESYRQDISFEREGAYVPADRTTWIKLHDFDGHPVAVVIDGTIHSAVTSETALNAHHAGWFFDDQADTVTIKATQSVANVSVLLGAPFSSGVTQHVNYFDLDGDLQGDPHNSVVLPSEQRIPGLVLWGNDPDDGDPSVRTETIPKNVRKLGYDLLSLAENGILPEELLRDIGIEVGGVTLNWSLLESAAGFFDGPQAGVLPILSMLVPARGWQLDLTTGPVINGSLSLPQDFSAEGLASPALTNRFNAYLSHIHASLGGVPMHSLRLGSGLERFAAQESDPQIRAAYLDWLRSAKVHAKALWGPGLQISVTMDMDALLEAEPDGFLHQVVAECDVVSLSWRPLLDGNSLTAANPWEISHEMDRVMLATPAKPVHFVDLAYSDSLEIGSSATRQVQFIGELLQAWDRYHDRIPYVSFSPLVDRSPEAAEIEASKPQYGGSHPELVSLFQTQGLLKYEEDGQAKPAYHTLRNGLFERGWWLAPERTSRSFLLGFSAEPYDQIPGPMNASEPFIGPVIDEMFSLLNKHADMAEFHFDNGVPWVEAEDDTLKGNDPPYGENMIATWDALKSRANPGQFTAVTISPLGAPRIRTADYWGSGEGYYLGSENQRVANGIFQDYQNRLPPGAWSARNLDSPEVRDAFLNYAKRTIDYFHPEYLIVGLEVNETLDESTEFAQSYISFQQFIYQELKSDPNYCGTTLVVSVSGEFLLLDELGYGYLQRVKEQPELHEIHRNFVLNLLPHVDVLGLSLHPAKLRMPENRLPVAAYSRLFKELRELTDKPLAITETDYPAAGFSIFGDEYSGSPVMQERYVKMLIEEVERDGNFDFLIHYALRDFSPRMDRLRERALETPPFISPFLVEFYKLFEFTGLYDNGGVARPALASWQNQFVLPLNDGAPKASPIKLVSPEGVVQAEFFVSQEGQATYRVERSGAEMLRPSPLGLTLDGVDLGRNVVNIQLESNREINESYRLLASRSLAANRCLEATLALRRAGPGDALLRIEVRVYDDGVAYRYVVPEPITGDLLSPRTVAGESSGWVLPSGSRIWHHDQTENYESDYRLLQLGLFNNHLAGQITAELPGSPSTGYLFITEASLRNYSGMTLKGNFLSDQLQASFLDDESWQMSPGQRSPWRVTMVADSLSGLIASDLIPNLNEAPDPALFPDGATAPWIKPGRALWSWWNDPNSGADFEAQKRQIDFADSMGLEYVTVDIYWELGFPANGKDQFERLAELVDYAKSNGRSIDIWVWKNWFELIDHSERMLFLQRIKDAGVAGVKIDSVYGLGSESQNAIRMDEAILRDAASLELMVNFHGTHKAHGLFRTYPNAITHEGLRGMETSTLIYQANPEQLVPPEHNAALVFTRFLAGPGDYTPVTFDPPKLGKTTFTHQLALAGLFTSPLIHFADDPSILANQPVSDILTAIPTAWDETVAIGPNKIGEFAMLARRKGDEWWFFGINGKSLTHQSINDLSLSFLGTKVFRMTLVMDNTAASFNRQDDILVSGHSQIDLDFLPGGGCVARFSPAPALDYPSWAELFIPDRPELRGELLDPDFDGLSNLLEMAQCGNPLIAEKGLSPKIYAGKDDAGQYITFQYRHRADTLGEMTGAPGIDFSIGGLGYRAEFSGDMAEWKSVSELATVVEPPLINGDGSVTVRLKIRFAALPAGDRNFLRLNVRTMGP